MAAATHWSDGGTESFSNEQLCEGQDDAGRERGEREEGLTQREVASCFRDVGCKL